MSENVTPDGILQLGLGFWGSKTLLSAVELGLFEYLSRGPRSARRIAIDLKINARSVNDFLDALVALHMIDRVGAEYVTTPETDTFLVPGKPTYVGGLLEMANTRLYPFWGSLTEALRTGKPQNEAKDGGNPFEALYAEPDRLKQFLGAMTGLSLGPAQAMAKKFNWDYYTSFADIGCAQGGVGVQLASAHPHLNGWGFDLPAVKPVFEDYVSSFSLEQRLQFTGGDMFTDPWPPADVFILGHILHDWGLEKKKQLLAKAHAALPKGGAVIVHESLIDDGRRENALGLLMSLNMLIETQEGFDFSGADCKEWLAEAGFTQSRVEHLAGPQWMVVGVK